MNKSLQIRLSDQQLKVVNHLDGALLVVAGPGSGKTRVLTERIRSLLKKADGHFRVLGLTFTNKAADEMKERLTDLGDARDRAFLGTLHSFCLDLLIDRGKPVGIEGTPNIFEQMKDRKEVLLRAVAEDPVLADELNHASDSKQKARRLDEWLQLISKIKSHPLSFAVVDDEFEKRLLDAYDAGMKACNVIDFDDILSLTFKLLSENPKVAGFFRRLYRYICIDEAQDLNEAQYAVLCALCGDQFRNVMMVGDPKQSIYGFNTSSPEYMTRFEADFKAIRIELTENFRSSQAVVSVARSLDKNYLVDAQLPVHGTAEVIAGNDEEDEAALIASELERLFLDGHPDVEGPIVPSRCAVLGRTRFVLLKIEKELKDRGINYYRRVSVNHENESDAVDEFQIGLRVLSNPSDRLHLAALAKKWKVEGQERPDNVLVTLESMAQVSGLPRAIAIVESIRSLEVDQAKLEMMQAISGLRKFADTSDENERRAIHEDLVVFQQEWDQYLRSDGSSRSLSGFLSSKALGATQKVNRDGVAILTVHSAKGLEFDVVFVAGMVEGVLPDYRATTSAQLLEEGRSAFVAVTRSKRLLYLCYPKSRLMPWGDQKRQTPSRYLRDAALV